MWTLACGQHEDQTPTHGYAVTRAARAEAGARRSGTQARHPLGTDLEGSIPLRRPACMTALSEDQQDER
jgi:hypothetical protein